MLLLLRRREMVLLLLRVRGSRGQLLLRLLLVVVREPGPRKRPAQWPAAPDRLTLSKGSTTYVRATYTKCMSLLLLLLGATGGAPGIGAPVCGGCTAAHGAHGCALAEPGRLLIGRQLAPRAGPTAGVVGALRRLLVRCSSSCCSWARAV